MIRIGILGLDTSHAPAFTDILNNPANPHHIPGARIVAAYPGGSADIPLSATRVGKFTDQLKTQYQIPIFDTPQAVAEASDLLFLLSIDGRVHLPQFKEVLKFRRPAFIDKPLATTSADAAEIFRLANASNIPVMSTSSLRYPDNLTAALGGGADPDPVLAIDICGPLNILPEPPGYFFYGIHTIEVMITTLGTGAKLANITATPKAHILTYVYPDGRTANLHLFDTEAGGGGVHHEFGITLHRAKSFQTLNLSTPPHVARPAYASMLEVILKNLPNGKSAIPQEQTLEVIRLLEEANKARSK